VSKKVTLPAGKHVLRLDVTKEYFDIDYIQFVKGDAGDDILSIADNFQVDPNSLQDYYVVDPMGVHMGVMSAYGFDAAAEILRSSSAVKSSGVYYLRNRATGKMVPVSVSR
jgi:hypothetical protein